MTNDFQVKSHRYGLKPQTDEGIIMRVMGNTADVMVAGRPEPAILANGVTARKGDHCLVTKMPNTKLNVVTTAFSTKRRTEQASENGVIVPFSTLGDTDSSIEIADLPYSEYEEITVYLRLRTTEAWDHPSHVTMLINGVSTASYIYTRSAFWVGGSNVQGSIGATSISLNHAATNANGTSYSFSELELTFRHPAALEGGAARIGLARSYAAQNNGLGSATIYMVDTRFLFVSSAALQDLTFTCPGFNFTDNSGYMVLGR
jgi:hypothetical protein